MTRKVLLLSITALCIAAVLISNAASQPSSQAGNAPARLIGVDGQVKVNGTAVKMGAVIASDSTITTATRSSAVVSLGKLGRVEVFPNTNLKLTFDDEGMTAAMLDQGRVRVSSSSGVNAHATTPIAEIKATDNQRNEFIVDTTCGNTFVSVHKGAVELRAGNSVKQIAAGGQDTAGQAQPSCTPEP